MRQAYCLGLISCAVFSLVALYAPRPAVAAETLMKGAGPAVYLVTDDDVKHVFPNHETFVSWYGTTKPTITRVAENALARYADGAPVTVRPGSRLLRFEGSSRIYAVGSSNVLRYVTAPHVAAGLYGSRWGSMVVNLVSDAITDYSVGGAIETIRDFSPSFELGAFKTLSGYMKRNVVIADGTMSTAQKRRAEQITSVFESGTPAFDYGVVVSLGDGRGYTAGRIGFTTGTGDAYTVAQRYTDRVPDNPVAPYVPRLRVLRETESGSVSGLEGFSKAWAEAANDIRFRAVQDEISDEVYYNPAMAAADELGLKHAFSRAVIYDTIIQHGGSHTSPDGLFALINLTTQSMGGSPKTGADEKQWMYTFLEVRKNDLLYPMNKATQAAWAASAGRVDLLKSIADSGNWDLHGPIRIGWPYESTVP